MRTRYVWACCVVKLQDSQGGLVIELDRDHLIRPSTSSTGVHVGVRSTVPKLCSPYGAFWEGANPTHSG